MENAAIERTPTMGDGEAEETPYAGETPRASIEGVEVGAEQSEGRTDGWTNKYVVGKRREGGRKERGERART